MQMQKLVKTSPGVHSEVHAVPGVLEALRETPPPDAGVLSIYLDISVRRVEGQAYLRHFREGTKELRAALESAERPQRQVVETALAQADDYITHVLVPRYPGLALFASGKPDYFFVVPLPERPEEEFAWDSQPHLTQLEAVLDEHERVAVALFDKRRTRLFTVFLGQIESALAFESDVPGKHSKGGWAALAQTRYARRHEDRVLQHTRRTTRALMDLLRARSFDRLLIGGPEEATSYLREELPLPLRDRLVGTLSLATDAGEAEVRQAALDAAEAAERHAEVEMVRELVEAATTPRAVLGLAATLDALSEDRVYHLFVVDGFVAAGSECPKCRRLVAGKERCSACGGPTIPLVDLGERVVERAFEQGARVEVVGGEAGELLKAHGGLGAWTRY